MKWSSSSLTATTTDATNSNVENETEQTINTDDMEQMQLNPSSDFYDDDDEEEDDDDDEGYYSDNFENYESIPEPKGLVQVSQQDEQKNKMYKFEEEDDMGYDEDDERIAAAERSAIQQAHRVSGYMNEEGSGVGERQASSFNRYKNNVYDNRFSLDGLRKSEKKEPNLLTESGKGRQIGARESSGNFANDDDEDDGDDDDGDGNDSTSDDDDDDDGFFKPKRKTNNRYFRKNTNDAIKIISTPLGKVGIVYQQTPQSEDELKRTESVDKKPTTSLTDFDALSPDPDSSRLGSSHPKITPVLTPDGKVALLYRGDSENTKYEPIRNLTHKFNSKDTTTTLDNTKTITKDNNNNQKTILTPNKNNNDDYDNNDDDEVTNTNTKDNESRDRDKELEGGDGSVNKDGKDSNNFASFSPVLVTPTTGSFIIRPTDSVLPMINRPLSEVLGIKKNQFKQFRIKDMITTSTDTAPYSLHDKTLTDQQSPSSSLHYLTKVNLAEYPTNARGRNRDFDFSQDNTMLDERNRHKDQEENFQSNDVENNNKNTDRIESFANEETLSKTEVVDLAIIPHFDNNELNKHDGDGRRHHRNRQMHRHRQKDEDLSGIHCIMQAMMGIAAISTVFGMLGTFFKQRILDQIRLMHW